MDGESIIDCLNKVTQQQHDLIKDLKEAMSMKDREIEMLRQQLFEERMFSKTCQCEIRQLQQERNILRMKLKANLNEVD